MWLRHNSANTVSGVIVLQPLCSPYSIVCALETPMLIIMGCIGQIAHGGRSLSAFSHSNHHPIQTPACPEARDPTRGRPECLRLWGQAKAPRAWNSSMRSLVRAGVTRTGSASCAMRAEVESRQDRLWNTFCSVQSGLPRPAACVHLPHAR
ncbi:hypothetical protein HDV62DRAFT_72359 [Trichoderma sp. SZMC 28011]